MYAPSWSISFYTGVCDVLIFIDYTHGCQHVLNLRKTDTWRKKNYGRGHRGENKRIITIHQDGDYYLATLVPRFWFPLERYKHCECLAVCAKLIGAFSMNRKLIVSALCDRKMVIENSARSRCIDWFFFLLITLTPVWREHQTKKSHFCL